MRTPFSRNCRKQRSELDKHAEASDRLLLLSLSWPNPFNPFKRSALTETELNWMRGFSCADVKCFKPADRATVLAAIRRDWGSEQEFDAFVQTKLPTIFARSKQKYCEKLGNVAFEALAIIAGD